MNRDLVPDVKEFVGIRLDRWLTSRRNEAIGAGDHIAAQAIDQLVDETRDAFVVGRLPWDKEAHDEP